MKKQFSILPAIALCTGWLAISLACPAHAAQMSDKELKYILLQDKHTSSRSGAAGAVAPVDQPEATLTAEETLDAFEAKLDKAEAEQKMKPWLRLMQMAQSRILGPNYTPHHIAEITQTLIEAKADVDAHGHNNFTPLMWAAGSGLEGMVAVLLRAKAKVNTQDEDGNTALTIAAKYKNKTSLELLLTSPDANLALANKKGKTVRDIVREKYLFPNSMLHKLDQYEQKQQAQAQNQGVVTPPAPAVVEPFPVITIRLREPLSASVAARLEAAGFCQTISPKDVRELALIDRIRNIEQRKLALPEIKRV